MSDQQQNQHYSTRVRRQTRLKHYSIRTEESSRQRHPQLHPLPEEAPP
jgi:hypothetical protein